jgi:long-chain acyl-CoA synthetase
MTSQPLSPLRHAVQRVAAVDPDRPALSDDSRTITYGELARELAAVGPAGSPERASVRLAPRVDAVVELLCRSAAGHSLLTLDPAGTDWELKRATHLFTAAADVTPEHALGLCTSGTGGLPRVVDLGWEGVLANAAAFGAAADYGARDRIWVSTPVAHLYGLGAGVIAGLLHGAGVVLAGGGVGPGEFVARLRQQRISVLLSIPFLLRRFVTELGDGDGPVSLRATLAAGEPVDEELVASWRASGGGPLHSHYGLTEGGHITLADGTPGTGVGAPLPGVELALDRDGLIAVRRAPPARPYRVAGEAPAAGGWCVTGDRGHLDPAGNLHITGRAGDRINIAGKKVDPTEVEQQLRSLDGVHDCAVAAVPRGGEEQIVAFVHLDGNVGDGRLRSELRRHLSAYKLPRRFVRVEEIPRTATGKIRRGQLIAELWSTAGQRTHPPSVTDQPDTRIGART